MPIEPVKIPQNVYVEDRIVGPITLRHLIILGIGGGISYVIYAAVTKAGYKEIPIQVMCWIPLMIAAAFSFLRINDLSLLRIILLWIEQSNKPNIRYWSPSPGLSINLITRQTVKAEDTAHEKTAATAMRLVEMTQQLEAKRQAMNKLSAIDLSHTLMPSERNEGIQQATMSDHGQTKHVGEMEESTKGSSLPINTRNIQATGLEPARSIDTIVCGLPQTHAIYHSFRP